MSAAARTLVVLNKRAEAGVTNRASIAALPSSV
jgi:hypothetical protein